ncbi:galactokinase [Pedobacter zeae]|uniref:Galactokinase n=1 Tax=Pedobacter zeae TaxID=1737356 RepID=A0A7W6K856_9SPHI|nr:galactokinase [Pedobacter zeae]MBB4106980.1 galactokinase [Pedobacter zeae]GGH04991.1 galactokinase [Pedobacter zeae]
MDINLKEKFAALYHKDPDAIYFTPGRVNLIGEHIDYNGGLVMPCAITLGTWVAIAPNHDNKFRFKSLNFEIETVVESNVLTDKNGGIWANYPIGVINEFIKDGKEFSGIDFLFYGNIPIGSGLSSSASIEIATAYALNSYFNLGYDKLALVKIAKNVENKFIGLNSGIMDQFAVAFGEKNKAIVLDCETLKYKMVDVYLGNYVLVIINTNKPRELADSKYNERVAECQTALQQLNQEIRLDYLCELNAEKFALHNHLITDKVILNRATHVVKENDRVHLAAKALNSGNLEEFGRLMYASHESLKTLYEVSGKELDTIVDFCKDYQAVIGARMTGAGFGGCAIALLEKGYEEDFAKRLTAYYTDRIGYPATIYVSEIGDGPHLITDTYQ